MPDPSSQSVPFPGHRREPQRACRRWALRCFGALLLTALAAPGGAQAPAADDTTWEPALAPEGPVLVVIGLSEQRAWVYRNGVRIATTPVSTGRSGHETPTGVFSILEKRREHYSNLYDDAPMPYMQRLTWDGIALHAGTLPGYPASHGCIRLPLQFSERLFSITARGTVVVVADSAQPPSLAGPGLAQSPDAAAEAGAASDSAGRPAWHPERAPQGPLSIIVSTHDGMLVVLRNGVEIGRAPVSMPAPHEAGSRAYQLLAGAGPGPSALLPDRPALRWLQVPVAGTPAAPVPVEPSAEARLGVDPGFARQVYDALAPGATVLVTAEPLAAVRADVTVLLNESPAAQSTPDPARP
ncbi:L,D-transpeptidase family protein [Luteimonas sp. SJ-92]|uniref:L,D-transpeptidase family protein n=1 Tax=Luteimonas salinisoli TaxID=2752307 RepID=A0A853JGK0_9GAMM|nr:L,D-transpeptidase family protein [Luteimonas salinisoli]NZA27842.1 L,D-transpeptidase family protein [Luteimonas salinisoli]